MREHPSRVHGVDEGPAIAPAPSPLPPPVVGDTIPAPGDHLSARAGVRGEDADSEARKIAGEG
jgi:hypothetical protein